MANQALFSQLWNMRKIKLDSLGEVAYSCLGECSQVQAAYQICTILVGVVITIIYSVNFSAIAK